MRKGLLILILAFVAVDVLLAGGAATEPLWYVVGGWIWYAKDILPRIQIDWMRVISSIVWLGLFVIGVHWFAGWLYRETGNGTGRWQRRWTIAGVGALMLMFVAGTAATAVVHQFMFMATTDPPMKSRPDYARGVSVQELANKARREWETAMASSRSAEDVRLAPELYENIMRDYRDIATLVVVEDSAGQPFAIVMFHRDPAIWSREGVVIVSTDGSRIERDRQPEALIAQLRAQAGT